MGILGLGRAQGTVLNRVVRESLRERVMFKQRLKGMKELSNVDVWRRVF